jgi:hypothetical protein
LPKAWKNKSDPLPVSFAGITLPFAVVKKNSSLAASEINSPPKKVKAYRVPVFPSYPEPIHLAGGTRMPETGTPP